MTTTHHITPPTTPETHAHAPTVGNKSLWKKISEKCTKKVVMILLATGLTGVGAYNLHSWSKKSQNNDFRQLLTQLVVDFKGLENYTPGEIGKIVRELEEINTGGIEVTDTMTETAERLHDDLSGKTGEDIKGNGGSDAQDAAIRKVREEILGMEKEAFQEAEKELHEAVDNFAGTMKNNQSHTLLKKLWLSEGWLENVNDRFGTHFSKNDADNISGSITALPDIIKRMGSDARLENKLLEAFGIKPNQAFPQTTPTLGTIESKAALYHKIATLLNTASADTEGLIWGLEKKATVVLGILLLFSLLNAFQTPGTRWAGDVKKLPKKLKNKKNKPKLEATKKSLEPIKKTADHLLADIVKIDEERDRLLGTLDDDYNHAVAEEASVNADITTKTTELATLRSDKIRLTTELTALTLADTTTKTAELIALEAEEATLAQELADLKKRTLKSLGFSRSGTAGEIAAAEIKIKANARKIAMANQTSPGPGATTTAKAAKQLEIDHNTQEIDEITKEITALRARLPQLATDKRTGAVKIRDYEAAVRTITDARAEVHHFVHELDTLIQNLKDGIDPKVTTATMMEDPKKAEKELKIMQEELTHIEHRNLVQDSLTALEHIKRKLGVHTPPPVTAPTPTPAPTPHP